MPPLNNNVLSVRSTTQQPDSDRFSTSYVDALLQNLNALRKEGRFCDVEIVAGGRKFASHRCVLSASSPYFEAMFNLGLSEEKAFTVTLHSIAAPIFANLIDFIYSGVIDITSANVQELLAAADMLQIDSVTTACCEFLCRELHPSNALGILRFAQTHSQSELARSAQTYVSTHFPQVAEESELVDIPAELLVQLIASEELRVDSEHQVFSSALRWIQHDIATRRRHVFEILQHVRLPLVPMRLISGAIESTSDVSLRVALSSVKKDMESGRGHLIKVNNVSPRLGAKKSIFLIGGSVREPSNLQSWKTDHIFDSVIKYDIFRKEWTEIQPMKIARILPGVAAIGGRIYVFGGERGSQILANGECLDTQTGVWESVAPMITPRAEFGLTQVGGYLWAIGGWVGEDIGASIECYNPVKDAWKRAGELPEPRFSMGVVSFEGLIYIVGGCTTSSRHLPDLISFNPVTREFCSLARMQTARCQMGCTILNRHLYVCGGNSSSQDVLNTVERYSFDEDKWSTCAPMSVCRASPAVCAADGLLYVAGGDQTIEVNFYRAQITVTSFETYNPDADEWKDCPDLPTSRSEAGAVVV